MTQPVNPTAVLMVGAERRLQQAMKSFTKASKYGGVSLPAFQSS